MAARVKLLGKLSAWTRGILLANFVVSLLAYPATWSLGYMLYETEVSFETLDLLALALLWLRLGLFAIAAVAVSLWTWRAWSNLHAAGLQGLRFSPLYAVGVFFIPILNLFEPLRAMRELYNRSAGEDAFQADTEVGDATAWWSCTIAALVVNLFLWYKAWFNTNQMVMIVGHWATEMAMDIMSNLLIAGSAFFLFRLVGKVAGAQAGMVGAEAPAS
jgi:hypothetical protein